jgi:orotidine-5'-phosphate decarboxylase
MTEIILALDVAGAAEARQMLDRLPQLRWVKVGSVLFTAAGPALVAECESRGLAIFLDLKWHDIPNTVAGSVRAACGLGVAMVTVHTLGGPDMLAAAVEAAAGRVQVVGVTALTSHDAASFATVVGRPVPDVGIEVARLAGMARKAGLDGVVCSPRDVAAVSAILGTGRAIVVPGIRRPGDQPGDQARAATPVEAIRAGATHLVVGRPILEDSDPAEVLGELLEVAKGS